MGQLALAFLSHPGGEQFGLAGKVVVERAFRDAGARCDAGHARALVAVAGEDRGGAAKDLAMLFR